MSVSHSTFTAPWAVSGRKRKLPDILPLASAVNDARYSRTGPGTRSLQRHRPPFPRQWTSSASRSLSCPATAGAFPDAMARRAASRARASMDAPRSPRIHVRSRRRTSLCSPCLRDPLRSQPERPAAGPHGQRPREAMLRKHGQRSSGPIGRPLRLRSPSVPRHLRQHRAQRRHSPAFGLFLSLSTAISDTAPMAYHAAPPPCFRRPAVRTLRTPSKDGNRTPTARASLIAASVSGSEVLRADLTRDPSLPRRRERPPFRFDAGQGLHETGALQVAQRTVKPVESWPVDRPLCCETGVASACARWVARPLTLLR
jgi:hypothetical protein